MFRITEGPSSGGPCTVLAKKNYNNDSTVSVGMDKVGVMAAYCDCHWIKQECSVLESSTWSNLKYFTIILIISTNYLFFYPMPTNVLVDFVVFPPGHGRSVTGFRGWDAHEARLRCPDDVSGDIGGCNARRALKHKFY